MRADGLPINLQDATVFAEIDPDTLRGLLDAAGETQRLPGDSLTWERLRASLDVYPPGEELSDAIEIIHELGTDPGRELILQAALDQQLTLDDSNLPAREFCARLWIQSRTNTPLRTLLKRARFTVIEVGHHRAYQEYASKTMSNPPPFDKDRMKAGVETWYKDNRLNVVDIYPYERDGEWYCEVIKSEARKRVPAIQNKALSVLEYEPAGSDVIRYDPDTGRIGIATRSRSLRKIYRQLLGSLIANNEDFFSNENICSLRELQKQGRRLFDRRFPGILRIDVVELLWRRGDRDKLWVRGRDCFQILEDLDVHLREGELVEAKLTVTFAGGGRPGHVSLKAPSPIDINAGIHRALVERMLDDIGIRGSFGDDEDPQNFWSRYPWRLPEPLFRRQFPNDGARLVQQKIFRPANLESATHPDHPAAKSALRVMDIDAHTTIGISNDPDIPSRMLTPSDISAYELDYSQLAHDLGSVLEVEGACEEITAGLWLLGRRTFGTASVSVFLATRETQDTTAALVRDASSNSLPILLIPKCCPALVDIPNIPCSLPQGPHTSLLAGIIQRLNLQDQVEPHLYAPEDMIIDQGRALVWFRKVPLTALKRDTHAYKFVITLAQKRGDVVDHRAINEALSSARHDNDAPKKAKKAFMDALKESFAVMNVPLPADLDKIIVAKNSGYALVTTSCLLA